MNEVFKNITIQNYNDLKNAFKTSKEIFWDQQEGKLIHPGEYGGYREELLNTFLSLYIPESYGIASGFVITQKGNISNQCDLIIYDRQMTPKIQNTNNQRFFPIETILAVGEVKSTIQSQSQLNKYLVKLSEIKKLRSDVKDPTPYKRGNYKYAYNPDLIFSDNVSTFLFCYKFDFDIEPQKIDYRDIDRRYWHNMVFSLENGFLAYKNKKQDVPFCFSEVGGNKHKHFYGRNHPNEELPLGLTLFLSNFSFLVNNGTLLEFHMERYLTDNILENISL